ncbi:gamma carbonic anhydrase family protein [Cerasicoccus arenae]|uniref:Gamma carbonic anhydrase family protein n=1 Tax=Cerasicoccus arenae TaxID=424488 RepID=A0A8J3D9R4_9BACT|nr:gamma carbonic anhydrase family protein [Cerasicoccus arenae]MBK1857135.1 gamma carbonic anhydrase family protein [Cerasicoccus arenae]GHB92570.1 gamma carbonic anhydrase family protein [Cerasicoccus arenae]
MTLTERLDYHLGKTPEIHPDAYVSPQATLIGDVTLKAFSSIWPGAVLRGDINSIAIGEGSNVQDGSIVHLADDYGVEVGDYVTIGHLAMIHACAIGDEALIGMHSTILDGAVIGPRSIVGAKALVTKNFQAPEGSVIMGVPGKIVKTLTVAEQSKLRAWAEKYVEVSAAFKQRKI